MGKQQQHAWWVTEINRCYDTHTPALADQFAKLLYKPWLIRRLHDPDIEVWLLGDLATMYVCADDACPGGYRLIPGYMTTLMIRKTNGQIGFWDIRMDGSGSDLDRVRHIRDLHRFDQLEVDENKALFGWMADDRIGDHVDFYQDHLQQYIDSTYREWRGLRAKILGLNPAYGPSSGFNFAVAFVFRHFLNGNFGTAD